jgi:hypothetical protein
MTTAFSDLTEIRDGKVVLPEGVHPMPDLLDMDAEAVLEAFRLSQRTDFTRIVAEAEQPGAPLHKLFAGLRDCLPADDPFNAIALFRPGALDGVFLELHDHVMSHPVWRHPFFTRVFEGRITPAQIGTFAVHYFNQIKNTRQCVALAIGRFHSLASLPFGAITEQLSEITQISLAQLVADEYGVGTHGLEDYPDLAAVLSSKTHIAMYRQVFDGLGIPTEDQDQPLLQGVADNVLTQRLVAGHAAFSPLEALASVGLGMEWGVPEFFSLLLGGLIRVATREQLPLNRHHLEVFIAHVRYDVLHAVSVMLVTSLYMRAPGDVAVVKNACNTLMASRYGMMTDLYRHVFGESCPALAEIGLEPRYRLHDRRIEAALVEARAGIGHARVMGGDYRNRQDVPFVFA